MSNIPVVSIIGSSSVRGEVMDIEDQGASGSNVTATPVSTKRKLVDADGKEVSDSKRSKAEVNITQKQEAIALILHWHEYLVKKFGGLYIKNIDIVADVTSIVYTVHTKFRQEGNGFGSMKDRITDDFEFKVLNQTLRWRDIKTDMATIARLYRFVYDGTAANKERIGTLSSLLVLFGAFRSRLSEVRMGNDKVTYKKRDGRCEEMQLSQFGLNNSHCIFLTGCTYTPTLQSSMKGSLGPLTIVLNLCLTTDTRYQASWVAAFTQTFKLLPNVHEIAEVLKGSKQNHVTIIEMLGNLCMAGIARPSNKAFIPMSLMMQVARRQEIYHAFFQTAVSTTEPITPNHLHTTIKTMDFSGKGLYTLWNSARDLQFEMRAGEGMTNRTAQEVMLHAAFGTHKENFALLEWMTGHSFQTRREIDGQFRGRGSRTRTVGPFHLIPFRVVTKLANAAQTDFLVGGKGQICRAPTFSGSYSQRVDLSGDFIKIFRDAETESRYSATGGVPGIISTLRRITNNIRERITKEGRIKFGTTMFYMPCPDDEPEPYYGDVVEEPQNLVERYFYQQDSFDQLV